MQQLHDLAEAQIAEDSSPRGLGIVVSRATFRSDAAKAE
jgi:hypothetical protein